MVASLAAAAKGYDLSSSKCRFRRHVASSLSINPRATRATGDETIPSLPSAEYEHILRLNCASMILYLVRSHFLCSDVLVNPFVLTLSSLRRPTILSFSPQPTSIPYPSDQGPRLRL